MKVQAIGLDLRSTLLLVVLFAVALGGCGRPTVSVNIEDVAGPALTVSSSAFVHQGTIPALYTCDGDSASPPLAWSAGPEGTLAYALIVDDPDAPIRTFVHWVAWNIGQQALAEGTSASAAAVSQGTNSGGKPGYTAPCPPLGEHRYFFTVYALDSELDLPPSTTKEALLTAMEGHVLAKGQLMGRYARQ